MILEICIFQIFFVFFGASNEHIELTTPQGKIVGSVKKSVYGKEYFTFQGIPYAHPPIGNLRFKESKYLSKWNGKLDGTKEPNFCTQMNNEKVLGSEDCLYVNVASRKIDQNDLLPVMVYILGGGFIKGPAIFSQLDPGLLMNENVVLVLVNFRLNVFGFLNYENESLNLTSNNGLKDIINSLKWVKNNIKFYGGDPNSVTVFGVSMGSVTANLLLVSPMAKGLFHRVICLSAVADTFWVFKPRIYNELFHQVGCHQKTEVEQFECFKDKDAVTLIHGLKNYTISTNSGEIPIGVTIEKKSKNREVFIDEWPFEQIKKGQFSKVPAIFTHCSTKCVSISNMSDMIHVRVDFKNNEDLIPKDLNLKRGSNESIEIAKQIKEFYYGNSTPSIDNIKPFYKYISDIFFLYKISRTALQISKSNKNVYFAEFNMFQKNFYKMNLPHFCEEEYLFYNPTKDNYTEKPPISNYSFIKMLTTFAKFGDPNPKNEDEQFDVKWLPIANDQFNYLKFGLVEMEMLNDLEKDRRAFWDTIYNKYEINHL